MDLQKYQTEAVQTAVYNEKYKVLYPALLLSEEAGEVAGKISKMLRDNNGKLTKEIRENLIKEMGDCLWALAALAEDLNTSLTDVAIANLNKLKDRAKREVIHGEGDER